MEIKNKKFNFLGDSITEGCGVSSPDKKYVSVFEAKYKPAVARNYGISGTRFARQINPTVDCPSFDRDFCSRVCELDPDADFVIVYGGVNDFFHGDAPFGVPTDRTPETFVGACHTLMRSIIEKFPTATVIFMTPLHGVDEEKANKNPLLDYVNTIKNVAAQYAIPVLDLYTTSGIVPSIEANREALIPDGVHPNDAGAERIAHRLASFISSL